MIFSYEFLPGYLFQVFDNDIHSLLHGIKLILLVLCQFADVTEVVNRNIYITRSTAFVSQCSGKLSNFFADAEVEKSVGLSVLFSNELTVSLPISAFKSCSYF